MGRKIYEPLNTAPTTGGAKTEVPQESDATPTVWMTAACKAKATTLPPASSTMPSANLSRPAWWTRARGGARVRASRAADARGRSGRQAASKGRRSCAYESVAGFRDTARFPKECRSEAQVSGQHRRSTGTVRHHACANVQTRLGIAHIVQVHGRPRFSACKRSRHGIEPEGIACPN